MKRPVPMKVAAAAREMGANLSAWRRMQGLSSEEVAQRAGVSRSTVSRLEGGDASVGLATVPRRVPLRGVLDSVVRATDPYETDFGRARRTWSCPRGSGGKRWSLPSRSGWTGETRRRWAPPAST